MSDAVLDFLVVTVAGGTLLGHPGLRDFPPPAWEAEEELFKDPAAAQDFARRIAAIAVRHCLGVLEGVELSARSFLHSADSTAARPSFVALKRLDVGWNLHRVSH